MKPASFSIAILSFFSRHGQYFHPTKDQPRTRPASPFLYICCNFGQIFCTNVIQFFSVENMGHNQLRKCSKYHLVSLLNEKLRSTFANFWHRFLSKCPSSPIVQCAQRAVCSEPWILNQLNGGPVDTQGLEKSSLMYLNPLLLEILAHVGRAAIRSKRSITFILNKTINNNKITAFLH